MLSFSRLITTISLAVAASGTFFYVLTFKYISYPLLSLRIAAVTTIVPPASRGTWNDPANALDLTGTDTDIDTIVSTANIVDQKAGATGDPDQPIPETAITAVDGQITAAGTNNTSSSRRRSTGFSRRGASNYEVVFSGTGTGPDDRDGSIQGTAYLTFTLVPNSTYNVDACLAFCDSVELCVFANLYYEFNNDALDHRETSNLKCAVYADVHTAAEKTNLGGQQLEAPPAGLTYIQQSSGYSSKTLVDPADPEGYELVFGPTNGANNAPGYMGFAFLDRYDVDACAQQCNTRGADGNGGACQYFNIWRAVVNGNPTTYTCSMYFIVADASTAVNTGQGSLQVTFSRGYKRKNFAIDGGFEGFNHCDDFCFESSYGNWIGTSPAGGLFDATIFFFQPYAHSGNAVALLGSANGNDALAGTLTPAAPLATVAGKHYTISFFHASAFSGPTLEAGAFVDVLWNGNIVTTIAPGFQNWQLYQFSVVGAGKDLLAFHGGKAPAWSFIDDVTVFEI
ncbi:hypothetical protein M413DRAFT_20272 [Hebeloma cylindrosporum]|uniref:Fruit-body specific protein a n=1 Tax=Hebeloma cylindrosporum TaxID=76867 RepID=A0A0C2Y9D0_HEBCY|nr:hypothetical protein M413DRAFT_20272 [Hebeloma cylindrosporum h7]